jgi:hypothetical protein
MLMDGILRRRILVVGMLRREMPGSWDAEERNARWVEC